MRVRPIFLALLAVVMVGVFVVVAYRRGVRESSRFLTEWQQHDPIIDPPPGFAYDAVKLAALEIAEPEIQKRLSAAYPKVRVIRVMATGQGGSERVAVFSSDFPIEIDGRVEQIFKEEIAKAKAVAWTCIPKGKNFGDHK